MANLWKDLKLGPVLLSARISKRHPLGGIPAQEVTWPPLPQRYLPLHFLKTHPQDIWPRPPQPNVVNLKANTDRPRPNATSLAQATDWLTTGRLAQSCTLWPDTRYFITNAPQLNSRALSPLGEKAKTFLPYFS